MAIKHQDLNITNYHEDHIASCLCCERFYGDLGESDWSDVTPGSSANIECLEGEFDYGENDDFSEALRNIHNLARHCKVFVPRKDEAG